MTFNIDPNKQAQEDIFSRKLKKTSHPPLNFNIILLASIYSFKNIWAFIWKINWDFVKTLEIFLKR